MKKFIVKMKILTKHHRKQVVPLMAIQSDQVSTKWFVEIFQSSKLIFNIFSAHKVQVIIIEGVSSERKCIIGNVSIFIVKNILR